MVTWLIIISKFHKQIIKFCIIYNNFIKVFTFLDNKYSLSEFVGNHIN